MCNMDAYQIDLREVKDDVKTYHFHIDDDFFAAIQAPEITRGNLNVDLQVKKVAGMFEVDIHSKGVIYIPCDICLDDMEQPIETHDNLVVRLGLVEEEEGNDDIVTVDEKEGIFDASWYIYEFIILGIPIKHVHEPGKCNQEMLKMLKEHQVSDPDETTKPIDPRWKELLKIKDKD